MTTSTKILWLLLIIPIFGGVVANSQTLSPTVVSHKYHITSPTFDSNLKNNDAYMDAVMFFDPYISTDKKVIGLNQENDESFEIFINDDESRVESMVLDLTIPEGVKLELLTPLDPSKFKVISATKYIIIGVSGNNPISLIFKVIVDKTKPVYEEIKYQIIPESIIDSNLGNNKGSITIVNFPKKPFLPNATSTTFEPFSQPVKSSLIPPMNFLEIPNISKVTIPLPLLDTVFNPIIPVTTNSYQPSATPTNYGPIQIRDIPLDQLLTALPRTGGFSIVPFGGLFLLILLFVAQVSKPHNSIK